MTKKNRLIYLPLGGAGEIGMNMYLYGYGPEGKERFILVDVGLTFPSMDGTPGVDLILPDPKFIADRADRLDGIFITHAHEDHIGALARLYPQLGGAPIYARRFTARVARGKMEEAGQDMDHVVGAPVWPETLNAGPFKVAFMPVAHSIPEASGLVIDTPAGRIVHTGDFKTDPNPIIGEPHDPVMLTEIGKAGVHALVCDSTNVFSPNPGRSEADTAAPLTELISGASGLMVATTFASNVARLKSLAQAGHAAGRSILVLGRAMQKMMRYADETGVLTDFPPTVDLDEAHDIPRENLMLIVTGSQGERRAASAQLANGKYLGFTLREGDTFLFSSKTIPGNEVSVGRIINSLSAMGVRVIDENSGGMYHVSGHANRPDLAEMHRLMKPKILLPMHGEHRHLRAHVELGKENGIAGVIAPNGTMVDITGDVPQIVDHIETGRVYLDGTRLVGAYDGVVLERIRMATRGVMVVSIMLEGNRVASNAWAEGMGLASTGPNEPTIEEAVEQEIDRMMARAKPKELANDDSVEDIAKKAVSRICSASIGKKPVTKVFINRLE